MLYEIFFGGCLNSLIEEKDATAGAAAGAAAGVTPVVKKTHTENTISVLYKDQKAKICGLSDTEIPSWYKIAALGGNSLIILTQLLKWKKSLPKTVAVIQERRRSSRPRPTTVFNAKQESTYDILKNSIETFGNNEELFTDDEKSRAQLEAIKRFFDNTPSTPLDTEDLKKLSDISIKIKKLLDTDPDRFVEYLYSSDGTQIRDISENAKRESLIKSGKEMITILFNMRDKLESFYTVCVS